MFVPLDTHYGTWADPVVRFQVTMDAVVLGVLILLILVTILGYYYGATALGPISVVRSTLAVLGILASVIFLIPLIPIPSGHFFIWTWPGTAPTSLVIILGITPGILGLVVLWWTRTALSQEGP